MSIFDDIGGFAVKLGKGLVKEVVGNIFGDEQPTEEDKVNIAKAEELAVQRVQQSLDEFKMTFEDKANARAREIALKDATPMRLAVFVSLGFFGVLGCILFGVMPEAGHDVLMVMLGALGAAWTAVIQYYFGSSTGSRGKDEIISRLSK